MDKEKTREWLVELIGESQDHGEYSQYEDDEGRYLIDFWVSNEDLAEHLLANGVTFATDTNDGCKWIPVSERLPEVTLIKGIVYPDVVNVFTSGRKVITAIWDGTQFIGDMYFWEAEDEEITHWMAIPELPKEAL